MVLSRMITLGHAVYHTIFIFAHHPCFDPPPSLPLFPPSPLLFWLSQTQAFPVSQSASFVLVSDEVVAGLSPGGQGSNAGQSDDSLQDAFYPLTLYHFSDSEQEYNTALAVLVMVIVASALVYLFLPRRRRFMPRTHGLIQK